MIKLDIDRVELIKTIGAKCFHGEAVEIGSFKGEFARNILNVWGGHLYMIDVWMGLGDEYKDMSNHNIHTNAYAETINNLKGYEERSTMIRCNSWQGSNLFQDKYLDFAYIDANHAYEYVKDDILTWFQKVKIGGYLMGHDYIAMDWYNDPNFLPNGKDKHIYSTDGNYIGVFGVNPAVDEFCKEHGYELTITNEWFGTWMIQKK